MTRNSKKMKYFNLCFFQRFVTNISETTVIHEPNTPAAKILREWYKNNGKTEIKEKLSNLALQTEE